MGDPEDIRKHEILLKERDMMLDKANSEVFRLALVEQERYSMEKDLFRCIYINIYIYIYFQ